MMPVKSEPEITLAVPTRRARRLPTGMPGDQPPILRQTKRSATSGATFGLQVSNRFEALWSEGHDPATASSSMAAAVPSVSAETSAGQDFNIELTSTLVPKAAPKRATQKQGPKRCTKVSHKQDPQSKKPKHKEPSMPEESQLAEVCCREQVQQTVAEAGSPGSKPTQEDLPNVGDADLHKVTPQEGTVSQTAAPKLPQGGCTQEVQNESKPTQEDLPIVEDAALHKVTPQEGPVSQTAAPKSPQGGCAQELQNEEKSGPLENARGSSGKEERKLTEKQAQALALLAVRLNEPVIARQLRTLACRRLVVGTPVDPCPRHGEDMLELEQGTVLQCEVKATTGWCFGTILSPVRLAGQRGCFRCEGMRAVVVEVKRQCGGDVLEFVPAAWGEIESLLPQGSQHRLRQKALQNRIRAARALWESAEGGC